MRFLPKDEGFFGLFDSLSARLNASAVLLRDLFNDPKRLEELAGKIKQEEHGADATTYEIMQRIDRSFVTPLDREDIHMLANRLDNVVDLIDGTARRATMFHITERRDTAIALIDVLVATCEVLSAGVRDVRKPAEVHKVARKVKELEERADALYAKAIGALFQGNPNPLDVIKWKEIYDNLEHAVDECEDVANVFLVDLARFPAPAPAIHVIRDRMVLAPGAVGVREEIGARLGALVDVGRVDAVLRGRCRERGRRQAQRGRAHHRLARFRIPCVLDHECHPRG